MFLKLSRLVKRRTVAREMIEAGVVRVCGRQAKPSAEVRAGDMLEIAFPRRVLEAEVLEYDERAAKRGAPMVKVLNERRLGEDEKPW